MNMIERMATALEMELMRQDGWEADANFRLNPDLKIAYLDQGRVDLGLVAKAIIEAMREPTDHMLNEGALEESSPIARRIWQAMLDAAIEEHISSDHKTQPQEE